MLKYRLAEGTQKVDNLISLTSSAHFDPIFRSHDPTLESVGKGSGHLQIGKKKRGEPRIIVTAAGGGAAESGHGIEFRTLGLFQVEMRDAPTLQQIFFVMSSFVGHRRLVGLLELLHEIFHILFQVGCRTGLFLVGGSIG